MRGVVEKDEFEINSPIGRNPNQPHKQCITPDGKDALTIVRVLKRFKEATFVELTLVTGRTHQIRVHMAHIGHPVLGDPVYGRPTQFEKKHPALFMGQCLHAGELTFVHPRSGERVTVSAPLPENFKRILTLLDYKEEE